jgi:hypothetical protein
MQIPSEGIQMKKLVTLSALGAAVALVGITTASAGAATVDQKRSFGTIARGSTICVGPIPPAGAQGVQLFGFTNANTNLTWQVLSVSSQTAPTVVFQTTARSASVVVPPSGNLLYEACVIKDAGAAQDFDLTLNAAPLG